jgi:hypothetical protein
MALKKVLYLIISIFLISNTIFSQAIFRDGYIVKNNGDVLKCLIEYKLDQGIPSSCISKRFDIAVKISYKPNEIKGFGYSNGNRYESKQLDNHNNFYEVLVSGNITLYCRGSKFFLEKGQSGLVELKNGSIDYMTDGKKQNFDDLNSFLTYITEGNAGNIKGKINLKKDIAPIITKYNKESGNPFIVYNREFSEKMVISESLRSGTNLNRYEFLSGLNIYYLKITTKSKTYFPTTVPEFTLVPGFMYERIISRKNENLSLRIDLMFTKQTFYSYSEEAGSYPATIYRDDAFFGFTGIKLPLLVQYSLSSHKIIPYFNAGVSYTPYINRYYLHIREIENTSHVITTTEDNKISCNKDEITGILGAGFKLRILKNIKLNVQGRVELGNGLLKENPNLNYSQHSLESNIHSIQSTLLIGISF